MRRRVVLPIATVALALAATGCSSTTTMDHSGMAATSAASAAASSPASPAVSSAAASPMSSMDADAAREGDIMFAQMMIPHHQQAIEMSDLALKQSSNPAVKTLAAQIKAAQAPEVAQLTQWLTTWGAGADDHMGMAMDGMLSAADMTALKASQGSAFDKAWATGMIAHHESAVTMARDVLTTTQDAAVKTMAQNVIDAQSTEIETLKAMLKAL